MGKLEDFDNMLRPAQTFYDYVDDVLLDILWEQGDLELIMYWDGEDD